VLLHKNHGKKMFRKKTNQPTSQTNKESHAPNSSDKISLKDILNSGIECIPESKTTNIATSSPAKINYTVDDFITKNHLEEPATLPIHKPEKLDKNMHSISNKIKVSSSAGKIMIEKIEDEGSDSLINEIDDNSPTNFIMQRPQDVLNEWSNFSQLHIGLIALITTELQKVLKFIAQSKNGELTAVQASNITPQHIENIMNLLAIVTEKTNSYKDNAIMSLGLELLPTDIDKNVINRILDSFIIKESKNEFIDFLTREGYL
jgi:hypothetical protein